jgi:hypothetical protein
MLGIFEFLGKLLCPLVLFDVQLLHFLPASLGFLKFRKE